MIKGEMLSVSWDRIQLSPQLPPQLPSLSTKSALACRIVAAGSSGNSGWEKGVCKSLYSYLRRWYRRTRARRNFK